MEHVTGNTTWVQFKQDEKEAREKRNETLPYNPKKWKFIYSGFLIDLLNKIVKEYEITYKKKFPDYEITTTPVYLSEANGGFGYRGIPKTGAGAKKEETPEAGSTQFGGLVKEVACNKVCVFNTFT